EAGAVTGEDAVVGGYFVRIMHCVAIAAAACFAHTHAPTNAMPAFGELLAYALGGGLRKGLNRTIRAILLLGVRSFKYTHVSRFAIASCNASNTSIPSYRSSAASVNAACRSASDRPRMTAIVRPPSCSHSQSAQATTIGGPYAAKAASTICSSAMAR